MDPKKGSGDVRSETEGATALEHLSQSVKQLDIKGKMDIPGGLGSKNFKLEALKKDVLFVLAKYPEGVTKAEIWSLVQKHTGRVVNAKSYGLSKMGKALELWKDCIVTCGSNQQKIRLKGPAAATGSQLPEAQPTMAASSAAEGSAGSSAKEKPLSAMSLLSEMQKHKHSADRAFDVGTWNDNVDASNDTNREENLQKQYETLVAQLPSIKSWIHEYVIANRNKQISEKNLRNFLRTKLRINFKIYTISEENSKRIIKEHCQDIVYMDERGDIFRNDADGQGDDDDDNDDTDSNASVDVSTEEERQESRRQLDKHVDTIRVWIQEYINKNHKNLKEGQKFKGEKLNKYINEKLNKQFGLMNCFHRFTSKWFYSEYCKDILQADKWGRLQFVEARSSQPTPSKLAQPSAMSLMSSLSSWGKPAVAGSAKPTVASSIKASVTNSTQPGSKSANQNTNQNEKKTVPSFNFISLVDDQENSDVIDLTDDKDWPKPSETAVTSKVTNVGQPALVPRVLLSQQSMMNQGKSLLGQFPSALGQFQLQFPRMSTPLQSLQPQFFTAVPSPGVTSVTQLQGPLRGLVDTPITSQAQNTSENSSVSDIGDISVESTATVETKQATSVQIVAMNNPFAAGGRDSSLPGFRDQVVDLTTKPIDGKEFEKKVIDVRPVYLPRGSQPPQEQVEHVAKECIEMLADANEFVTQERVEQLVCKRFGCNVIRQLGFRFVDQIPCVNELNRLVCKINAYVIAFVKTRSLCTLHELREALRDYVPDKGDFSSLKVGPLQRFPVVYQQFKFPPDQAEIPEITSMDILDHFHNYLTRNNLWTKRLELEPFMDYLVQEYSAENAYMLGVRIRSLPLAAAVLKKAQRDTGNKHREITDHFKEHLKNQIEDSFRKFRASILQTGEGDGMEVRSHYLKMRPEVAIAEVFDKFSVLMMVTQVSSHWKSGRGNKFKKALEDFLKEIKQDEVGKVLLHLAICMTNLAVEDAAVKFLAPAVDDSDDENDSQRTELRKPPPRKDELVKSLKTYIERCLNAGALSLNHLDRIEEKLLEDFEFTSFNLMGHGRFLEFLLAEMKKTLEEGGGLTLGSGSGGGDSETSFKPHQTEIVEFIKQCSQCGLTQPEQIEEALCRQYSVKEVRHLGYGNITRLLSHADKQSRHIFGDFAVFYGSSLVPCTGLPSSSGSKVGMLGHQTRDAAKICLHNCPLLENLAEWSQWSLVFEPELGKLKDFVQKYGGSSTKTVEGGRMATLDFLALELKPGELIKIVSDTSPEHVAQALEKRDVLSTAGHLVSMVVAYKGVQSMPLALLCGHVKTALLQMHAGEASAEEGYVSQHTAALFVLQCLLHIPTKICVALANHIFLEPLGQVMGSSKSKQVLIRLCQTVQELNRLVELGCLLGIQEWTAVIQQKCQLPESAIQIVSLEAEELFKDDNQEQEEEESEIIEDSDTEEIDEILTGDLDKKIKDTDATDVQKVEVSEDKQDSSEEAVIVVDTENDVVMADMTQECDGKENTATPSCEDIINEIRRDEFGVGVHLSEDGQRLMKVQQERLGRSLDRLSKDLYSKDTHFVLELIQNADDNSYHDNLIDTTTEECPAVKFVIQNEGIYVLNNELGFREKNIRALCDVGRSTKGKHKFGYIGQKGIGFKSVFRVTDTPEVHSNGFHIKFDVKSGPMGYILPHWVPEEERVPQDEWMTHIILKLKSDMRLQTRTLAARFNDIHPSLLLFLHRLRQITIENKVENSVQTMRRRDVGDNVVEIQHTDGCERWLVIKRMLDARKISTQAKSGADVESTEIALAFPLRPQGQKSSLQVLPPKQPVFAFLPLRSYGFRFIVQGDFDVPSSREDVDRDSSWNQWLRNEIHTVFLDAIDVFKTHPEFSSIEAVCTFLQFVPMEDEVLDFFKPVASDILKKLKAKPCVPTQPNAQGVVGWKMPSQTVRVRDPLVRSVITPDLLQTHLNLFYLHSDVAAMLNPTLTSCLGIETLTSDHLFQLGKALIVKMGSHCSTDEEVVLISRWLACMYRSLDEFQQDDTILSTLKSHKILPLSTGELVSILDKTVFYPLPNSSSNKQRGRDPMYYLQQDVNSLHPVLLGTDDDEVNSQVHKLLLRLGIKQLSPFDIINHHIIPVLKSDKCQSKSKETLISYLVYIKEQTDKQPSVCNLEEVKDIAIVMTNQGLKNPSKEPVHFPPQYGNQIDLQQVFHGYNWTLLDTCYLPHTFTKPVVVSWQDFFSKLGVEDCLTVRRKDVHIKKENLAKSPWCNQSDVWPKEELEYIVQDYSSAELEGLILHNTHPTGVEYANQMRNLCVYLDRNWDSRFSRYCVTHVLDKDGKVLKETDTSFSILLKTAKWLPAEETEIKVTSDGLLHQESRFVMKEPSCLYLRSDVVQKLLSNKVLYLDVKLIGGAFHQFLGLKNVVAIETVKEYLTKWCERSQEDEPVVFCTSLDHMKNVYTYLKKELKGQDFQDLLREKPVYFVPDKTTLYLNGEEIVSGRMLYRKEVWFSDRTGLFDKHRLILEEFHSEICRKRTIFGYYSDRPDIIEIFKQDGKIDVQPKVEEYIELLCLLCSTSTPKDAKIFADVLHIFTVIGQALQAPPEGISDEQTAKMVMETLKSTVKKRLLKQKVFPTSKLTWVSLEDRPMIADNREWEEMFADKDGVYFLDLEDKVVKQARRGRHGSTPRGYKGKVIESHVQPEMIDVVIQVCGIKKLSENVDIAPAPEMIEPCLKLQAYFHQIVPAMQQYLMARFYSVYEDLEGRNTKQMLSDAKFYQTGKLEVGYYLKNVTKDTFVIRQEKCVIHAPEFYFHREHLDTINEINREVARYFSCGNNDCSTSFRSFLAELANIVMGMTDDTIEGLLQRHEADGMEIPEDQVWAVEAPIMPVPDEPEPEPEIEEIITNNQYQDIDPTNQRAGSPVMRAWPPVASGNTLPPREKSNKPSSNIWPPPQAKDYMRSVRDLPSNIRVVAASDTDKTVEGATPGASGDSGEGRVVYPSQQQAVGPDGAISGQPGVGGGQAGVHGGHPTGHPGHGGTGHPSIGGAGHPGQGETAPVAAGQQPADGQLIADEDQDASRKRKLSGPEGEQEPKRHSWAEERKAGSEGHPRSQDEGHPRSNDCHARSHGEGHPLSGSGEHTGPRGEGHQRTETDGFQGERHHGMHGPGSGRGYTHRPPVIKDSPIWSYMSTEYTYDELGAGRDLGDTATLTLEEGAADPEIGRWGEALVAQYLQRQKDLGNILDYTWKNHGDETGFPYDFEVQFADEDGIHNDFIEVKSTVSNDKEVFEISVQQIKFASEKTKHFHIFRVFNAGNSERVRLIRITNLDIRLQTKQVKLCMLI